MAWSPAFTLLRTSMVQYERVAQTTLLRQWNKHEIALQAQHISIYDQTIFCVHHLCWANIKFGVEIITGEHPIYGGGKRKILTQRIT